MRLKIVGIHKVKKRLASGKIQCYYYAWRGGPRIDAAPGTRDFLAEYAELTAGRTDAISTNTFAELVAGFHQSAEFDALAPRTQKDYETDLFPHMLARFADLPIPALDERGMRAEFIRYRDSMANTPRRADMRVTAISRVLTWAVDQEIIDFNKARGIGKLYKSNRRNIIWSDEQLRLFIEDAPTPLAQAVMLALWTGQRQGDLLKLKWSAYDGHTIKLKQSKTGANVFLAVAPELKTMLDGMERTAITILTSGSGTPWGSGFRGYFRKWQQKLGIRDTGADGVRFHDLRGTFVTLAKARGYSLEQICDATGHTKNEANSILKAHYLATDVVNDPNKYRMKM